MTARPPSGTAWLVAALALAAALPAIGIDARMFWACWLAAWWFCIGTTLGLHANVWLHTLTGGRWGHALRPGAAALARRLPWLLLAFVPLLAGLHVLYPWAADPRWSQAIDEPAFVRAWLSPGFFGSRLALYGALWWLLLRPAVSARKGGAAAALALYLLSGSLASVDLLMSLLPGWFSTAFGAVVLAGQALGGAALGVLLAISGDGVGGVGGSDSGRPPLGRDLGNLLLMWLMLLAYLAFMEFLIIWAADLPHETAWYLPRLQSAWSWVAVALLVLQFGVPLLALLWRAVKDRPRRLAAVAALLLAAQWLNTAWLVLPSVAPHSALGWWLLPLLTLAIGLPLLTAAPTRAETRETHHAA